METKNQEIRHIHKCCTWLGGIACRIPMDMEDQQRLHEVLLELEECSSKHGCNSPSRDRMLRSDNRTL